MSWLKTCLNVTTDIKSLTFPETTCTYSFKGKEVSTLLPLNWTCTTSEGNEFLTLCSKGTLKFNVPLKHRCYHVGGDAILRHHIKGKSPIVNHIGGENVPQKKNVQVSSLTLLLKNVATFSRGSLVKLNYAGEFSAYNLSSGSKVLDLATCSFVSPCR